MGRAMMHAKLARFGAAIALAGLCACSNDLTFVPREKKADRLAAEAGWAKRTIATKTFDLVSFAAIAPRESDLLSVYIEGDGLAYFDARQISADPTPTDPVALRMALQQDSGNTAYLARPCQFVMAANTTARNCDFTYWTNARYSDAVVSSMNEAIDALKHNTTATRVMLVGYSGGGAMAVLLAARRNDVAAIVTIAANLDTKKWTALKNLTPLNQSLDPADFATTVSSIPQVHYSGAEDAIVPPAVARSFLSKMPPGARARLVVVPDFSHDCCWVEKWPWLLHSAAADIAALH